MLIAILVMVALQVLLLLAVIGNLTKVEEHLADIRKEMYRR